MEDLKNESMVLPLILLDLIAVCVACILAQSAIAGASLPAAPSTTNIAAGNMRLLHSFAVCIYQLFGACNAC